MYKPFKLEEIPKPWVVYPLYSELFIAVINSNWYTGYLMYDGDDAIFLGRKNGNGHEEPFLLTEITHYMLIPDCSHLKYQIT